MDKCIQLPKCQSYFFINNCIILLNIHVFSIPNGITMHSSTDIFFLSHFKFLCNRGLRRPTARRTSAMVTHPCTNRAFIRKVPMCIIVHYEGICQFFRHQKLVPAFPWIDNCLIVTNRDFLGMEASLYD